MFSFTHSICKFEPTAGCRLFLQMLVIFVYSSCTPELGVNLKYIQGANKNGRWTWILVRVNYERMHFCAISDYFNSEYYSLLGSDRLHFVRYLSTFWRNQVPPSSMYNSKSGIKTGCKYGKVEKNTKLGATKERRWYLQGLGSKHLRKSCCCYS